MAPFINGGDTHPLAQKQIQYTSIIDNQIDISPRVRQNVAPMRHNICIPPKYWTPFPNVVFDKWFRRLKEKHGAAVFAVLYDGEYHNPDRVVKASYSDISRWTNLDARVVKACIEELKRLHLVRESSRRVWEIPLADLDLKEGKWTPIPRLLIQYYIPAYHKSVLLLAILKIQHLNWLDWCWVGTATLSQMLQWSRTRVRVALREMSNAKKWRQRTGTDLPHPLKRTWWHRSSGWRRHYRVRAVRYEDGGAFKAVRFSTRFGEAFKVPVAKRAKAA